MTLIWLSFTTRVTVFAVRNTVTVLTNWTNSTMTMTTTISRTTINSKTRQILLLLWLPCFKRLVLALVLLSDHSHYYCYYHDYCYAS